MNNFINYSDEVRAALILNLPVVALESTVIAHGLPYPHNLETALDIETIVREASAIPAHICIKEGKIAVGLSSQELAILAKSGSYTKKLSTRDLSFALSQNMLGATTVASTMYCAQLAGVRVFATGGIGGVHRDGHISLDISADIYELSRTKVAVVCAGAKSILDIGRTLELLESLRVPVISVGTNEFPAFYSQKSGHHNALRLDTAKEIARLSITHFNLANTGLLIAKPIDKEHEIPLEEVEYIINKALCKSSALGIKGQEITPFLIKELSSLSSGKTLLANIALLKNNAKLAAEIAKEYNTQLY